MADRTLPIGYPSSDPAEYDPSGYEAAIATILPVGLPSISCRHSFVVPNPAAFAELNLVVRVDDGFVVWLNGLEVDRFNMPGDEVAFDSAALDSIETIDVTINLGTNMLRAGNNMLAIQVFNQTTNNGDLLLDAAIIGTVDDAAPTLVSQTPAPGATVPALTTVEVFFSEPVQGVDAGDLLINNVPATELSYGVPGQYLFQFAQPAVGLVRIAFAPNHGITDLAAVPNPFAGADWTCTLNPSLVRPSVIINELMAAGQSIYKDEDNDYTDWIELYNSGTETANLSGWFLTDDARNLTKWRIPAVTLGADRYLVVFASGKNRTNTISPARLHTNFQLGSGGEYLALVNSSTNVVSEFAPTFPAQSFGASYGRVRGSPELLGYFSTPTPAAANAATGQGFAPEVKFSRPSGAFITNAPFWLSLSNRLANATIYYALGTNVPGTNSTRYTGPLLVTNSTIVRARAFAPGLLPGPIDTRTYIALSAQTNIVNFKSDLPIMILHNFGRGAVPSGTDQYVVVQTFEPRFGISCLTNTPELSEQGIFHLRGSSTLTYSKGSFRLEVRDEYGLDKDVPLLGLPEDSDWVLYAPNNFEPALFHNPLAFQLARDMGHYGSRTRFVEVYLKDDSTANLPVSAADYNGIYVLEEKIKISKDRVNIDYPEPEDINPPEVTGGYLLSIDRPNGETQLSAGGTTMNWIDPSGTEMSITARTAQRNYITKYFNDFNNVLSAANWTNPVTGYAAYIEVDSWIDRHIHEVLTYNVDALRLSGYFYKPRNGKLHYGPPWDYDRTQGSTDGRDFNPRTFRSTCSDLGTDFFNFAPWWYKLFQAPDFWQRWIDRYQEMREDALSFTNISRRIDQMAGQVRQAQPRERAKWGVAPRSGSQNACGFTYNFTGSGYESEVIWKKVWYSNRLDFIDTNLLKRPSLNAAGGRVASGYQVTLAANSAKAGTVIYYTLDGTDPRASGGAIAPNARVYDTPITVTNNIRVAARAYNVNHKNLTGANNPPVTSRWSGSVADTYYLDPPPLRVTEIMYHPLRLAGSTNDADNFEFIEFKNTSTASLNLYRFQLRGGVEFDFPNLTLAAGQSCVVAADTNAFALRYGANNPNILVAGQYTKRLGNDSDQIILLGPVGEPILDFTYHDNWYPTTDGFGFSLVFADPALPVAAWSDASHWRPSRELGGSPGQPNLEALSIPPVAVNELSSHTDPPACDAVELYNPTASPADVGGWFLTDDFNTPKKYRIPPGTTIAAGDYLVFYATNSFGQDMPGNQQFQFSSHGDAVYLFSGDAATNLTGYAHGFDFGAQFNGATFGRYATSTSNEVFVSQSRPTLGATNAGPRAGPVVISEIMFQPPDILTNGVLIDNTLDEYIEILNITSEDVPLYDPAYRTNSWRLQDGIDFVFPTNVVLRAGGYALVVNFDPADPALADAFRQRYMVPQAIPLFGPFSGKLSNTGERIEMMRPDHPEPPADPDAGYVPYVLVERISYSIDAPWPPFAVGLGIALQRVEVTAFGNDPANWTAAVATPGVGFAGCDTLPSITRQPAGQTVVGYRNLSAQFSVAATGPEPLRYQWFWNDLPLQNGTGPTLEIADVTPELAGAYHVVILNCAGLVASTRASLNVLIPVIILQQPGNTTAKPNANATFNVSASSSRVLSYQWRFNGVDIQGATKSSYTVTNVTLAQEGLYRVLVTDSISSELSQSARLTVLIDPLIVQGPQSQIVPVGARVDLSVQVTNTATLPIFYRLRRNNSVFFDSMINERAMTYTYTNIGLSNSASYFYTITNLARFSSLLSATGFVAVVQPPTNLAVEAGADAAFTVVVGNPSSLSRPARISCQWRWNGLALTNEPLVSAATNANVQLLTNTLRLPAVSPGQAGQYSVEVSVLTNVAIAPAVFAATLSVSGEADRDGDGLPDAWELAHGLNPDLAADATLDADGDRMSNLAEYQAGTDPQDAMSFLKVELEGDLGVAPVPVVVKFGAVSNKTYSVLYQAPLNPPGAWEKLADVASAPTNRTVRVADPSPGAPARFYRLVTPRRE